MKILKSLALAGPLLMLACDNVDTTALVPLYVPTPDLEMDEMTGVTTCVYDPSGPATVDLRIDLDIRRELDLTVATRNTLDPVMIMVSQEEQLPVQRSITPVNFDYRWECDSTGFSGDVGPIYLPAFSLGELDRPFCLSKREDVRKDFSGFSTVSANGQAIDPGSTAIVEFTAVPKPLGDSLANFFDIARKAEQCCQSLEADGLSCLNVNNADLSQYEGCNQLQRVFDAFANGQLNVTRVDDIQRFRPFSIYAQSTGDEGQFRAVPYRMRLSGIIEGVMSTGELVTSTRFNQDVGFCTTCGMSPPIQACLSR